MWVSRFSIPLHARGEYVALDDDLPRHTAVKVLARLFPQRSDFSNRLPTLGHGYALWSKAVEDLETFRLEFAGRHCLLLRFHRADSVSRDRSDDQSYLISGWPNFAGQHQGYDNQKATSAATRKLS